MTTSAEPNTRLTGRWLTVARGLWIFMTTAAVLASMVGVVISWHEPLPSCTTPDANCAQVFVSQEDVAQAQQLGLPDPFMLFINFVPTLLAKVSFTVVGLIIFWRKSDDWVALLLSLMLTLWTVEGIPNLGVFMPAVTVLYMIDFALFYVLPFIFPNGRFVPRWTRWVALLMIIIAIPVWFLPTLGIALDDRIITVVSDGTGALWLLAAGYAMIYRYRRVSNATERQQTKWVIAGFLGIFILIPVTMLLSAFPPSQPSPERLAVMMLVVLPLGTIGYFAIPAGVAFAILRYRLWDIDVIIRRTLQYSVLSGLLALTYFGLVIILQSAFTAITGQRQNDFVTVISTLAIAGLFFPLRKRVQDFIDRRFYRQKYNAQKVLAEFAATCRDETDLDKLTTRLAEVIGDTLQPETVSVWLKPANDRQRTVANGGRYNPSHD